MAAVLRMAAKCTTLEKMLLLCVEIVPVAYIERKQLCTTITLKCPIHGGVPWDLLHQVQASPPPPPPPQALLNAIEQFDLSQRRPEGHEVRMIIHYSFSI